MLWAVANIKMEIMKDGLLYGCDCIIMPLLAAEIPAKLSSIIVNFPGLPPM